MYVAKHKYRERRRPKQSDRLTRTNENMLHKAKIDSRKLPGEPTADHWAHCLLDSQDGDHWGAQIVPLQPVCSVN